MSINDRTVRSRSRPAVPAKCPAMYRNQERDYSFSLEQVVATPAPAPKSIWSTRPFLPITDKPLPRRPRGLSLRPWARTSPCSQIRPKPRAKTPQRRGTAAARSRSARCWRLPSAVAGWFGYDWWTVGRFTVSTDDAYVQAYNTTLAAKVSGYLASVLVTDNMRVHAGDVIATIDDGDYRLAVNRRVARSPPNRRPSAGSVIRSPPRRRPSNKPRPSSSPHRRRPRARNWNSFVKTSWSRATPRAGSSSSKPKPTAIKRSPASRRQSRHRSAAANVDVLKGQGQEAISTLTNSRPRSPRPNAICRSPSSARRSTA